MNTQQAAEMVGAHQADPSADQFLTFMLADEEYGIDILQVQEIRGWESATPIPNTPDFIKGVVNLRGSIVPVIDLRLRFNLAQVEYGPTTVVIVLKIKGEKVDRTVGIVVDAVSEVYNVSAEEMKPAPDFGGIISTDFLRGLATMDEKMVILLDINGLINSEVLAIVDKIKE